jgi:hypothetical protein
MILSTIGLDIDLLHCIISRILGKNQPETLSAEIQPKKVGKPSLSRQRLSVSHECKNFSAGMSNVCNKRWFILVN